MRIIQHPTTGAPSGTPPHAKGSTVSDSVIVQAWNTVLFDKFVRFRHLLVDGLSQHSEAALERCAYPGGARVLDIGCGFGDTTLRIARFVGPSGAAVGLDCAANFIEAS